MAPRSNKPSGSQAEGPREIRRSFFCDLCQKGYARSNELEAHENSYDHQHKKRLKEMKAMTRQAPSGNKRKTEKSEMISLNLQSTDSSNRPSTTTTSASKPKVGGFSDALRRDPQPSTAVESVNDAKADDAESEEKWEDRPLMWDELDEAEGMVDFSTRPAGVERTVDSYARYVEHRNGGMVDEVWKRIEEMKRQSV